MQFDFVRLVKYLLEGLAVSVAAWYIPKRKSDPQEIILLALVASVTFALLDTFAPSIATGARQGTGFGVGFGLAGMSMPGAGSTALGSLTGGANATGKDDEDTDGDSTE